MASAERGRGKLSAGAEAHVGACEACARAAGEVRALTNALAAMERPEPRADFELRLASRIQAIRGRRARRRLVRWAVPGAATLALAAALLLMIVSPDLEPGRPPIAVAQYAEIELVVEAREPVPGADLTFWLPAGVEPVGAALQGERDAPRSLMWTEDLAAGTHRSHLPVSVLAHGRYEVRAIVSEGGDSIEARLALDVGKEGIRISALTVPARGAATARFALRLGADPTGTFRSARS